MKLIGSYIYRILVGVKISDHHNLRCNDQKG